MQMLRSGSNTVPMADHLRMTGDYQPRSLSVKGNDETHDRVTSRETSQFWMDALLRKRADEGNKVVDAHTPDSATTAFSSPAMYCTGVPFGGVVRSCTRDLTTSSEGRV